MVAQCNRRTERIFQGSQAFWTAFYFLFFRSILEPFKIRNILHLNLNYILLGLQISIKCNVM